MSQYGRLAGWLARPAEQHSRNQNFPGWAFSDRQMAVRSSEGCATKEGNFSLHCPQYVTEAGQDRQLHDAPHIPNGWRPAPAYDGR